MTSVMSYTKSPVYRRASKRLRTNKKTTERNVERTVERTGIEGNWRNQQTLKMSNAKLDKLPNPTSLVKHDVKLDKLPNAASLASLANSANSANLIPKENIPILQGAPIVRFITHQAYWGRSIVNVFNDGTSEYASNFISPSWANNLEKMIENM